MKAIAEFADALIEEGSKVRSTARRVETSSFTADYFVEREAFYKWNTSCLLLMEQLGPFSPPWKGNFEVQTKNPNRALVDRMLGSLKSILENVSSRRLVRLEDIVLAEAFSNLEEQAEYLLERDYFLAAGVILRAVLEEKLRRLCTVHATLPSKARPTISDYNQALYKAEVYDKIAFKSVEDISGVGNDAAHGVTTLEKADVIRMHQNLTDFLRRN